jgi:hypothetical protein
MKMKALTAKAKHMYLPFGWVGVHLSRILQPLRSILNNYTNPNFVLASIDKQKCKIHQERPSSGSFFSGYFNFYQ